jgi:hypothetical protein
VPGLLDTILEAEAEQGGGMEAYCVKCKTKREMKDAKQVKMKNGRSAMKGRCPTCGTGLYRIMSS